MNKEILEKSINKALHGGKAGLMTRGLTSKIITNGIQGMVFTVLFDFFKNY